MLGWNLPSAEDSLSAQAVFRGSAGLNAEELLTGARRRCGNGRFVFVAVDAHGQSVLLKV